jgi:nucleoid-associated protein YgaU
VVDDADSGRYEVGTIYETGPVETTSSGELRHRVEDGDTLTKLAVRYLGRAEAFREIYELNRGVLADPDLLPIGAVLRIPARGQAAPAPESTTGMVPVPPRPGS